MAGKEGDALEQQGGEQADDGTALTEEQGADTDGQCSDDYEQDSSF